MLGYQEPSYPSYRDGVNEVADAGGAAMVDGLAGDDAEKISTMFSQEPLTEVKCRAIRG